MESRHTTESSSRQSLPRWKPTPEQVRILKEIFHNNGGNMPPFKEVQKFFPQLQQYGPIEPRNVYFWFMNKKQRRKVKEAIRATAASVPVSDPITAAAAANTSVNIGTTAINTIDATTVSVIPVTSSHSPPQAINVTTTIISAFRPPFNINTTGILGPLGLSYHTQQVYNMVSHICWSPRSIPPEEIPIRGEVSTSVVPVYHQIPLEGIPIRGEASTSTVPICHQAGENPMQIGIRCFLSPFTVDDVTQISDHQQGTDKNDTVYGPVDNDIDLDLRLGSGSTINHAHLGRQGRPSTSDDVDNGVDLQLRLGPPFV